MVSCSVSLSDEFYMNLNLLHRRLYVFDIYRLLNIASQKRLYSSCGCFLKRCRFSGTCDVCPCSYDITDL